MGARCSLLVGYRPLPELSRKADAFLTDYLAGPESIAGNGVRCYLKHYHNSQHEPTSTRLYKAARGNAARLLATDSVRARMRDLRAEAEQQVKDRLRSWWQLVPGAMLTLELAVAGELTGSSPDEKVEAEQIRQRVKAAELVLNRAMGTVEQADRGESAPSVVVMVAAPGGGGALPVAEAVELAPGVELVRLAPPSS